MISRRSKNRAAIMACFLILVLPLRADDRDKDDVGSFLKSMAATIYKFAWPTATYKQTEFGGFQRQTDGIAVVMKLSGEGFFGDDLWLKLGIVVNRDGIKDLRVLGHNALFAGPFEASKALGNLIAELGREYSAQQAAKIAAAQNTAGAVCVINSTRLKLSFSYRWGAGQWQAMELEPGYNQWFSWKYDSAEHSSPGFEIAYDEDLSSGLQERRYALDRNAAHLPVTCEQAARYNFTLEGNMILLRSVK